MHRSASPPEVAQIQVDPLRLLQHYPSLRKSFSLPHSSTAAVSILHWMPAPAQTRTALICTFIYFQGVFKQKFERLPHIHVSLFPHTSVFHHNIPCGDDLNQCKKTVYSAVSFIISGRNPSSMDNSTSSSATR